MCNIKDGKILNAIYQNLQKKDIDSIKSGSDIMQPTVYLLKEMGTPCGNYRFSWNSKGIHSDALDEDISTLPEEAKKLKITLNPRASEKLEIIRKIMNSVEAKGYSQAKWLEAVSAIHYIKNYENPFFTEEQILEKLRKRKPSLDKSDANKTAYKLTQDIK